MHSSSLELATSGGVSFTLLAHSMADAVQPWMYAAYGLKTDLGVASW